MTLTDFKIGDRVRVVADYSGSDDTNLHDALCASDVAVGVTKGYESRIIGFSEDLEDGYVYITSPAGARWGMFPEMLEIVT